MIAPIRSFVGSIGLCAVVLIGGGCSKTKPLNLENPTIAEHAPACAEQGLTACELACEAGDGWACLAASYAYGHGDGARKNETRMAELEERGCAAGLGEACRWASRNFELDDPRAKPLLVRGCELDHGESCGLAAMIELVAAPQEPAGLQGAIEHLDRGCELDDAWSCAARGDLYELGLGGAADSAAARPMHERACKLEVAASCRNLQDPDRVWSVLPLPTLFGHLHMPDPNITFDGFQTQVTEALVVKLGYCLESKPEATAVLLESSGEPALDGVMVDTINEWRLSLGPLFPEGKTVCFLMTYKFKSTPKSG